MKYLLSVCLAVLTGIAMCAVSVHGQVPALQKGISVQMVPSTHSGPMPQADTENAWVITVTSDGRIYFGTDQLTANNLIEHMKARPRDRAAKLYIKADAAAPFGSVREVLHAARVDLFDDVILLTSQAAPAQNGTMVPPHGLQVWIGTEAGSNLVSLRVDSELRVNNKAVDLSDLQDRLAQVFDNRAGRIVLLQASDNAPYAQVVHVIDTCEAAGASRVSVTMSPEI